MRDYLSDEISHLVQHIDHLREKRHIEFGLFKSHPNHRHIHDLLVIERHIMSALSDLQDAVANLQTVASVEGSQVLAAIADINSLPATDAALVPLTAAISAVATQLQSNADQLKAAIGTPPTPTPTPTPA